MNLETSHDQLLLFLNKFYSSYIQSNDESKFALEINEITIVINKKNNFFQIFKDSKKIYVSNKFNKIEHQNEILLMLILNLLIENCSIEFESIEKMDIINFNSIMPSSPYDFKKIDFTKYFLIQVMSNEKFNESTSLRTEDFRNAFPIWSKSNKFFEKFYYYSFSFKNNENLFKIFSPNFPYSEILENSNLKTIFSEIKKNKVIIAT